MREYMIVCPCCGRSFVFTLTEDSIAVKASDRDTVQAASALGVELGALKGGEEIGD